MELKEAICNKLKQDNDLDYSPSQVVVTCGAKHAVMNTLLALCQRGDEVILPSPYWTSYAQQVNFVDARPVMLHTNDETDFKITPGQLQEAITSQTKLLILNSPSNPTGCVYSETELAEIAKVLERTEVMILSDEIYEKITYDDEEHVSIASFPSLRQRVILINGVSKAYAMTGWRIGYMAANQAIIEAVSKVQSHSTSNACSISQKASLAALRAEPGIIIEMVKSFYERRNFLISRLQKFPGITCSLPKGAFYMFPNVSKYFGAEYQGKAIRNSTDFCSILLEDAGVAVVPGGAFGSENHVRISYATALENLKEAMERVELTLSKLRPVS